MKLLDKIARVYIANTLLVFLILFITNGIFELADIAFGTLEWIIWITFPVLFTVYDVFMRKDEGDEG